MKKLIIAVFSILLFASMSNTFAASANDIVLVSTGEMVCAGGPPSRHVIRNINDDVYLPSNYIGNCLDFAGSIGTLLDDNYFGYGRPTSGYLS